MQNIAMNRRQNIIILKNTLQCILAGLLTGLLVTVLLSLIVLFLTENAYAVSGSEEIKPEMTAVNDIKNIKSGTLLFKGSREFSKAPVLNTEVEIYITGMIARAVVKQSFRNPVSEWQEGIYVFPLPETAAVDHLRMKIGKRIIEGQIKEREAARKTYEKAKKAGKKTSLIEQERTNIFTTSVANIAPLETIIIEIEYQHAVDYDAGSFRLRFPMVVAPRYIPGQIEVKGFAGNGWAVNTDQVPDAARITPPVLHPDSGKINPVSISINLNSGFKLPLIDSPYHRIRVRESKKFIYQVTLQEQDIPADRDFELVWRPEEHNRPVAALFKERINDVYYAMLMVLPPEVNTGEILSREIIFVIDTSGSMSGSSIEQAKSSLQLALTRLNPGDRFNVIQFNSFTHSLFQHPEPMTPSSIMIAKQYIDDLKASGGTEMAPALHAALDNQEENNDIRQVVFLTDGSIGNEDALFRIIQEKISRSRLFTVGIGSAPNSNFMRRAANFGRGTHTYIGKISEVQTKMEALFQKLESPVLTNISVSGLEPGKTEIWPEKTPDLYLGEPMIITFRSPDIPPSLEINGRIAGEQWQAAIPLNGGDQQKNISILWARNKIASLMDLHISHRDNDKIKQEIILTALEHHLVSRFTSLVAVDVTPARVREELLKTRALPVNLPAGWNYEKVFGTLPRTATNASLYFFLGFFLIFLSVVAWLTPKAIHRVK